MRNGLFLRLLVGVAGMLTIVPSARAATFTVTSNADTAGATCGGVCTLRQAITAANAAAGADTIVFSAQFTITPGSLLPAVTDLLTLTGSSDGQCATANSQRETLDGNGANVEGFDFAPGSDGSRICRFNVIDFGTTPGIGTGIVVNADDITIDGNRIGVDDSGNAAGNNSTGISIVAAARTRIGGVTAQERNVISDNALAGITLLGASDHTTIVGNRIGTGPAGAVALGTQAEGIVENATASNTVIGGTGAGEGNLLSGNTIVGADVSTATVLGNLIGTDASGTTAVPNGTSGVEVTGAAHIGGTAPASRNLISGNQTNGVFAAGPAAIQGNVIGPDSGGSAAPAGSTQTIGVRVESNGVTVGGSAASAGNVISGNIGAFGDGVGIEVLSNRTGLVVQGNTIGLTTAGTAALTNGTGIDLQGTIGAQIGGTTAGAGNIVAGNTTVGGHGVEISANASGTVIEGNLVGLDAAGDIIASDTGIVVGPNAVNTRIGGSASGARNVIGGHGSSSASSEIGVVLEQNSTATTIQGNFIGLGPDGSTPRPNAVGVRADKAAGALIGGTAAGAGNVISGNARSGIELSGGDSTGVVVEGNLIGTDATGTLHRGNGQDGIFLAHAAATQIGGTAPGARNVIFGNGFSGVEVGVGADGSVIQGNTISANALDGVAVAASTGVSILGNAIAANGNGDPASLGIDLGEDGVTANDPGDGDDATHPNRLQNFPVLSGAVTDGLSTLVGGTIDTTPGATIRVELFSSVACGSSGTGQGEVFLGATTVTAGTGTTPFSAAVAGTSGGRAITATATNLATGDTSEFSPCVATPPLAPPPPPTAPPVVTAPSPVVTAASPAPTPPVAKNPAKLSVLRAGVPSGKLDMLLQITSRAATPGAKLSIDYLAAGKHTKFTVAIPAAKSAAPVSIAVLHMLPSSQAKLGTGIAEITYAGNSAVNPDDVRLRAATGKSLLVRKSSTLHSGLLKVSGTLTSKARGVVRIRLEYTKADASTGFLNYQAKTSGGKWSLSQALPADAHSGGELSIQFTGYLAANLRGEQTAKQVLG
jgi:CSLREA domain-containing protein